MTSPRENNYTVYYHCDFFPVVPGNVPLLSALPKQTQGQSDQVSLLGAQPRIHQHPTPESCLGQRKSGRRRMDEGTGAEPEAPDGEAGGGHHHREPETGRKCASTSPAAFSKLRCCRRHRKKLPRGHCTVCVCTKHCFPVWRALIPQAPVPPSSGSCLPLALGAAPWIGVLLGA